MGLGEGAALAVFGQIAQTLGTSSFHRGVVDVIRELFPSDFAQVYQIGRDGRAICLDPCDSPKSSCRDYEQQFSLDCPLSRYWQRTGRPGVITMGEALSTSGNYGNYFSEFYTPLGLVDEIGVLLPSPGRRAIAIFMERTKSFNDPTVIAVRQLYAGITRLHRANNQLILRNAVIRKAPRARLNAVAILDCSGRTVFANREWRQTCQADKALESRARASADVKNASLETDSGMLHISALDDTFAISPGGRLCVLEEGQPLLRNSIDSYKKTFLSGVVSKREHEIVCAMLDGYPTKVIADRVGCAIETVKVHKKRIYERLDITTEREIFLLFLDYLQRASAQPAHLH